jgi:DNA helicase II / ATP-dependent DNA helicase PcrA
VWAVERPFELHLDNTVVSGRADVILEEQNGTISSLAIVDYKTATDDENDYDSQLRVYASAGRREGLEVRGAFVHDLKAGQRIEVDVGRQHIENTEREVIKLVDQLKGRDFSPKPGKKCGACDVKPICRHAA